MQANAFSVTFFKSNVFVCMHIYFCYISYSKEKMNFTTLFQDLKEKKKNFTIILRVHKISTLNKIRKLKFMPEFLSENLSKEFHINVF